jgi:acetate kinase
MNSILVVNAGSSSVKFQLYQEDAGRLETLGRGQHRRSGLVALIARHTLAVVSRHGVALPVAHRIA